MSKNKSKKCREVEFKSISKPEKSLEIKNGKVIKNDFYYVNRTDLTIRFNNNKTGDYYALYRGFSLLPADDRNIRWHDFYRNLFAIVKYDLKWNYSDFNLTAYEYSKINDNILYNDIKIEHIEDDEDEYDIFL